MSRSELEKIPPSGSSFTAQLGREQLRLKGKEIGEGKAKTEVETLPLEQLFEEHALAIGVFPNGEDVDEDDE